MNCTFIPTSRSKDLLCALFAEFRNAGSTREILFSPRDELGPIEFGLLQKDLARLMFRCTAAEAVRIIIEAAINRYNILKAKRLRNMYEPPAEQPSVSRHFD
ncbi:MAG TPA: hypothetical protein VJW20_20410 [Candidatus Angelobacter sp.]|nr:hypothetical protein [Candidatus Angelobacter sp.]